MVSVRILKLLSYDSTFNSETSETVVSVKDIITADELTIIFLREK